MNVPVKQQADPAIVEVNAIFKQHRKAIEDALPKHLTADRMMRIALTELRKTPMLRQADPMSFFGAIVQASQLGLEPGGALGHCYLIPYGREVQLQLGYRGMVDLARRSGNIVSISARCVYEGDTFELCYGTEEGIKHVPAFASNEMVKVYAVAKMKDGGVQFEVMSKADVEHVRDTYSSGYKRNPKSSPWSTEFDAMAKKTVVRRLFKMLPTSIEIRDAITLDEDDDQHNAKIIDASYEVAPMALNPGKMEQMLNEPETRINMPANETDKKLAIEDFQKAVQGVKKLQGDPEKILGRKINEVLLSDAAVIQACADKLSAWEPTK